MKIPVFQHNIVMNKPPKTTHYLKALAFFPPGTGYWADFYYFLSSHMAIKMPRCSLKNISSRQQRQQ